MQEVMSVGIAQARQAELEKLMQYRPNAYIVGELAAVYFTLNQPERAVPLARGAWQVCREQSIGTNLAIILKDLGLHEESFHVIEQAYWLNPDDMYTRLAYAEALLRAGFWKQAWGIYDNARPTQQGAAADVGVPNSVIEWDGGPLPEGHRLLVINEGGTGDRISYARWLPELTKRGINWFFYPYAHLHSIFSRVLPNERLIADGQEIEPTHWTTTFALPARLNVGPTEIPEPLPLTATEEVIAKYKINRIDSRPLLGLCWRAGELHQGGRTVRSLSEGEAIRIACQTASKVDWVSLQYGHRMPAPVNTIPFETWEDTLGLLHNLDAVVTIDTGLFWLASAMKKPTALILGGNGDWKFLSKGKCYWSDSVTMYRNQGRGFENAINALVMDIRNGKWPHV